MIITDDEASDLKVWIIKKLEDISDADSDVLADYVLALIRADTPESDLRSSAIENLEDFLRENTKTFVDEIFRVVQTKSYLPGYIPPLSQVVSALSSSPVNSATAYNNANNHTRSSEQSRKRTYFETQEPQGQDVQYNDRNIKQVRRNGHQGRGRNSFGNAGGDLNRSSQMSGFPGLPALPMHFDPNDPMAAIMAMQAMGANLPGMNTQNMSKPGTSNFPGASTSGPRCRDYDLKGICTRGLNCPYSHSDNQIIIPSENSEYDPKSPSMIGISNQLSPTQIRHENSGGGNRGRGKSDRGKAHSGRRNNRAEFSHTGPNHDRSVTTIVVEQIPEESFDERSVREFFSGFGNIAEVTMMPYKRLALVKFDDYNSARAAYDSPKVIFDNRFVKVYWYKPASLPKPGDPGSSPGTPASGSKAGEAGFDREKFERDTAEAQKRHDDRKALQKLNDDKLVELERQKGELAKKQAEEKRKLEQKLKAKGQPVPAETVTDDKKATNGTSKSNDRTEALKAKLKELEQEAISLGLDPEPWNNPANRGRGRGRGRGSYRGSWDTSRGSYGHQGGYRGRGSFRGMPRGGGAYNLDNRPRAVKVQGVTFDDGIEESLKQHLFSIGEFTTIEPSDSKTSRTITFKDRKTAEAFFYGPRDVPNVGKLEFSWVQTPLPLVAAASNPQKDDDTVMDGSGVFSDEKQFRNVEVEAPNEQKDMDYDVAGDEDDWVT